MNGDKNEDKKAIFSHEADPEQVMEKLRILTTETATSHAEHDFSIQQWGRGVANLIPYEGAPFAKIYVHSPEPFKDGDMLITSSRGRKIASMVFDVLKHDNPADLYELHAVQANPKIGIGHEVSEAKKAR